MSIIKAWNTGPAWPTGRHRVLPGFRPTLSFALVYLAAMVVLPLGACAAMVTRLSPSQFLAAAWSEQAQAAYALSFGASLVTAAVNVPLGLLLGWVLVRYEFPFKRVLDSLVDLPFALPTAVVGLVYADLYSWDPEVHQGWFGRFLVPLGIKAAYSRLGIVLVLTCIGLPFVTRAVQPVLETLDAETEEAAASLGATRLQTFCRVHVPAVCPALVTGFALTFARSLGEYGSVVFVSGNMPFRTEIAPVLIVSQLESFHYADATAVAVVLLAGSFATLALINGLERWSRRDAR